MLIGKRLSAVLPAGTTSAGNALQSMSRNSSARLPPEGKTSSRTCEPERSLVNVDHQDDGRDRGRLVILLSDRAIFNFDSTKRTRRRLSQEPPAMRTDRTGLVLIEEAVQLLRTAPVTVFALYCGGTVPFLLALFSFCAEMSYSRDAGAKCTASAVIVALAYCWMKGLEVFCCRNSFALTQATSTDGGNQKRCCRSGAGRSLSSRSAFSLSRLLGYYFFLSLMYLHFSKTLRSLAAPDEKTYERVGNLRVSGPPKITPYTVSCLYSGSCRVSRPLRRHLFHPIHSQDPARYRGFSNTKLYLDLLAGLNNRPGSRRSFYH